MNYMRRQRAPFFFVVADRVYFRSPARIMTTPMDLSVVGMYVAAFRAVRDNLLIYLLLLLWMLVQGFIMAALFTLGGFVWLAALAATPSGPSAGTSCVFVTAAWFGILLLVFAILSAAAKAGVLSFGAKIRRGEQAGTLVFLSGILRFTLPLFVGGLVVGMLSCLPALAFAAVLRLSLANVVSDLFTSGWNFGRSVEFLGFLWNALLVLGAVQMLIFFWITPWDEMVVLYEMPYPEALAKSFSFVFSRRHFVRVVSLVVANVALAQVLLVLVNLTAFREGLGVGLGHAYLRVVLHAFSSSLTGFIQLALFPFFAFTQLYLLPWPETRPEPEVASAHNLAPDASGVR
jgi:hypothetical protein